MRLYMRTKNDKSLEEVWEMKSLAHDKFLNSGYSNYAEYINLRQDSINLILNKMINDDSAPIEKLQLSV